MQAFIGLCVLLGVGHMLRMKVRVLRKLYLPSCVIAGLVGLIVIYVCRWWGSPVPAVWTAGWDKLPGLLINVVFACLFLGARLPKMGTIARRAGPQLAYGQVVAWGQYVVGIGLFLILIQQFWDLPMMFGAIVPVGFEGGHGTAAGLAETFADHGWPDGEHFALASATIGMVSAIVVGMALINWAVRHGVVSRTGSSPGDDTGVIPVGQRPEAGKLTVSSDAIGSLTLHLVIVGLAIGIGWLLKQGMMAGTGALSGQEILNTISGWHWWGRWLRGPVEALGSHEATTIAKSFPLFPLCMLGGLIVQLLDDKFDKACLIDHGLMKRIQNVSLDFLIVSAIATINLAVLQAGWAPLLIICAAGILWNVFCVFILARRMLPNAWFERSIAEMGQSMGVTATGLMLLRVVDPEYETPAAEAFAAKQLLHEPFMGGGLWTSAAVPLLAVWGGWPVFWIAAGAMTTWLIIVFGAKMIKRA